MFVGLLTCIITGSFSFEGGLAKIIDINFEYDRLNIFKLLYSSIIIKVEEFSFQKLISNMK